jgi:LysM repeat protein
MTSTPAAAAFPTALPGATNHIVQPGETLSIIAARYQTTVAVLMQLNGLASPDFIFSGQNLRLPTPGQAPAPPPTTTPATPAATPS